MGRKKAQTSEQTAVEDGTVTEQVPQEEVVTETAAASVNKSQAIKELLTEWHTAGKSIKSNQEILAELALRYPGVEFSQGDVGNSKTAFKKSLGITSTPRSITPVASSSPTLDDLMKVKEMAEEDSLGVEGVIARMNELKVFAREVGSWEKLGAILEALEKLGL